MIVRHERASDIDAISAVTRAAFVNHPYSQGTEHYIVAALREANALTISLVAEINGEVVGHAAFSPITISDGTKDWYGLGPISVAPQCQRQGIGKALMHEGLRLLKEMGANGCALVGDPAYYEQFGFRSVPELVHEGVPQEYVMVLHFGENRPQGTLVFHSAFMAKA
jgi:putative acetyltransferase